VRCHRSSHGWRGGEKRQVTRSRCVTRSTASWCQQLSSQEMHAVTCTSECMCLKILQLIPASTSQMQLCADALCSLRAVVMGNCVTGCCVKGVTPDGVQVTNEIPKHPFSKQQGWDEIPFSSTVTVGFVCTSRSLLSKWCTCICACACVQWFSDVHTRTLELQRVTLSRTCTDATTQTRKPCVHSYALGTTVNSSH
jgi:hypothetical protein